MMSTLAMALYGGLLVLMLVYGLNGLWLVWLHARHPTRPLPPAPETLPIITVQLPVYNEGNVVARLIQAVGALDWPLDKLEIQVLDDSTDDSVSLAADALDVLRGRGLSVHHVCRSDRQGYKAGALAEGMHTARGELIALFDADFVPPPDFLRRAVRHFADPKVAAIQGRWTHLNRDQSALTRAQALGIDAHFGVEQGARCRAGLFMNFNGTAGVWRKAAIVDGGGWTADTLTEDLDLSYRVQLRGWRIAYDRDLVCPAELPADLAAFKSQQRRWATGSMQTARKLLPQIWRSDARIAAKAQATLHLTHYAVHPLIALTAVLSVPCVMVPNFDLGTHNVAFMGLFFAIAMTGPAIQHTYAQRVLAGRTLRIRDMGMLTLLGVGLAISNSVAVLRAWGPSGGEFVRTPKDGGAQSATARHYRAPADHLQGAEAVVALYCLLASAGFLWLGIYEIAPFILMDGLGLATIVWLSRGRGAPSMAPLALQPGESK
jgi:cellulose synthase/poly-beta-1,6-N-acetylglucosamine synthase-like glycosyltransferase